MSQDGSLYSGSLVALEGLPEAALETQLRLLPGSSQILVLPSLQQYLDKDDELADPVAPSSSAPSATISSSLSKSALSTSVSPSGSRPLTTTAPFDARRYIRSIHNAAAARRAVALEFLQDKEASTTRTPPKKFVFLNGGTATSHALCIEAIRQHETAANGNLEQAALLFDQLTAHGVTGLDTTATSPAAAETSRLDDIAVDDDDDDVDGEHDPITKAMRAADALDRKTEGLQPSTHILDLTITKKPRPRSLSLPIHGDLLDLWDAGRRPSQMPTANTNNAAQNDNDNNNNNNNNNDDASTINNRSFYWVPPSMAAGASGSEIYDVNNFSFITPASPTRGGSPTSTIFPVSMRLDAIASQQQRKQQKKTPSTSPARQFVSYRSATTGETMRTVVLGPAPRGRTARRRPSHVDMVNNNDADGEEDDADDDKTFYLHRHQPQQRRARSLERKPSIGAGSLSGFSGFSGISSISGFSGFSGSSSGNGLGMNMNFFLSTSSREPSSTRPRRTSNVSDDVASMSTSVFGTKPSLSSSASSRIMFGGTNIPDVPLLPAADALEKMTLSKKKKAKSKQDVTTTVSASAPQKKTQLQLKTGASTTNISSNVDHGPGTEPVALNNDGIPVAFEAVLPLVEDLVIRFDDDGANVSSPALELAIQRCRELDGAQIITHQAPAINETVLSCQASNGKLSSFDQKTISSVLPETPKSSSHGHSSSSSTASASLLLGATTAAASAAPAASTFSTDDYDPFAPHEYNAGSKLPLSIAVPISVQPQTAPSIKTPQPLTPAHTPPPQQRPNEDDGLHDGSRFHVLSTAKYQTALALQNGIRSILDALFTDDQEDAEQKTVLDPLTTDSPTSFLFSCLPGMEGSNLWAPLLSGNRAGSKEDGKTATETPATDMVLAIGSQRGVPSSLLTKVTGQLDALSSQPATGIGRGGRLDIRYLIANAMQTLAAQQVCKYGKSTGTDVLATLVIAQLDLYLRTYPSSSLPVSSMRLVLLDYPMELLPVVLAIQQLAGRDMVQVASIIAVEDSKYRTESRRPGFQMLQQPLLSPKHKFSLPPVIGVAQNQSSFKRANFLLTSAANETDVEAFVASVRKIMLSSTKLVPSRATSPAEVAFQNGMIPLTLVAQQKSDMGRYSVLSTATTAAGGPGTGISSSSSSRNSKVRTPSRTDNLMQSPTLPSPLIGNTPSPKRRGSSSEKDRKRSTAENGNKTASRPPPLPLPVNTKKSVSSKVSTAPSISAVRPPKSPALSTLSLQSQQSQASSFQSFQSQADSWRTTAKTPSYITQATGLAPAPVVLPSGRLVAKTIQVNGPTVVRRAKEQTAVVLKPGSISGPVILNNLVAASTLSSSSIRSDNDNLSNWDAGLDVSEDGNYTYDDPPFGTSTSNGNGDAKGAAINTNAVPSNANGGSTGSVAFGGYNDDDYDYSDDDDDFENDLDMRRLMPLFMRDRAALLAAKEAAGSRGVRPPPIRSKSGQITGASTRAASASAAIPSSAQGPPQVMDNMTGGGLRGLRGKASLSSIHSQHSHGSSLTTKNGNEGKKALKWLGLA
ncbi:hypothetical protein Sste5346_005753 [Sporothrix stenoceras]|uniref:Gastric mucin n=1 Tax=Sporothrix stenoceras TaxID=5173 RepID=A0ABR3Z1N9_9PEZI